MHWHCVAAALSLAVGSVASANLTGGDPDFSSGFVTGSYDSVTGAFVAGGWVQDLTLGSASETADAAGAFSVQANITSGGALIDGTISLSGDFTSTFGFSGVLLTGTLTGVDFGGSSGDPIEFLFTVTGGSAATAFGGVGGQGGVILALPGFGGFGSSFMSGQLDFGTADTFALAMTTVPLPSAAASGLFGLALAARRRRG